MAKSSRVQMAALIVAAVAVVATIAGSTPQGEGVRITTNTLIACVISAAFWYVIVVGVAMAWRAIAGRH